MNELAICKEFKWTLDYVRNLSVKDFNDVVRFMKKREAEFKKAQRQAKQVKR